MIKIGKWAIAVSQDWLNFCPDHRITFSDSFTLIKIHADTEMAELAFFGFHVGLIWDEELVQQFQELREMQKK